MSARIGYVKLNVRICTAVHPGYLRLDGIKGDPSKPRLPAELLGFSRSNYVLTELATPASRFRACASKNLNYVMT
jgi:hypothetical protein